MQIDKLFVTGTVSVFLLMLVKKSEAFVVKKNMPRTTSLSTTSSSLIEIEQKFTFTNRSATEDILRKEGFLPMKETTMVDWYFDLVENEEQDGNEDRYSYGAVDDLCDSSLDLPLIRRDHWMRYREILLENNKSYGNNGLGIWQLKRGNTKIRDKNSKSNDGSTVYEEVEGIEAVQIAHSIIRKSQSQKLKRTVEAATTNNDTLFDGYVIPVWPIPGINNDLKPFAFM